MPSKKRLIDWLDQVGVNVPGDTQVFIADDIQYKIDTGSFGFDDNMLVQEHDYGNVAPPFPTFFIEAQTHPDILAIRGELSNLISGMAIAVQKMKEYIGPAFSVVGDTDPEWVFLMQTFRMETHHSGIRAIMASSELGLLGVSKDGRALFGDGGINISTVEYNTRISFNLFMNQKNHEFAKSRILFHPLKSDWIVATIPMVLGAINTLHQGKHGAEVIEVKQPKNYRKAEQRKHGYTPRDNYYLKVGGVENRQYMPIAGLSSKRGASRSHFRVGHFKYYSESKPHVSGLTGMMWVNATTVKRDKQETINKRYEIKSD